MRVVVRQGFYCSSNRNLQIVQQNCNKTLSKTTQKAKNVNYKAIWAVMISFSADHFVTQIARVTKQLHFLDSHNMYENE